MTRNTRKPMDLKIISLNVRGLRDDAKRREVFNWLRRKTQSIYMLQEVHCTENTKHLWSAEWGYQAIFSSCKSNKAGVCLLFNNNFNLQIQKLHSDRLGRFIICDLKADGKCLTLANIYAPNDDNPSFFQNFFDHLLDFNSPFPSSRILEIWYRNRLTRSRLSALQPIKHGGFE